jgi:hypothetical protein
LHTTYASKYLSFTAVENEDRNHQPLKAVTSAQDALWTRYGANGQRTFPFLDFGNKYLVPGPSYDPKVLAGLTQTQIAAKLSNPNDPVAKAIDGGANVLTAAICGITNNQPASVCSSQAITAISTRLNAQPTPTPSS